MNDNQNDTLEVRLQGFLNEADAALMGLTTRLVDSYTTKHYSYAGENSQVPVEELMAVVGSLSAALSHHLVKNIMVLSVYQNKEKYYEEVIKALTTDFETATKDFEVTKEQIVEQLLESTTTHTIN